MRDRDHVLFLFVAGTCYQRNLVCRSTMKRAFDFRRRNSTPREKSVLLHFQTRSHAEYDALSALVTEVNHCLSRFIRLIKGGVIWLSGSEKYDSTRGPTPTWDPIQQVMRKLTEAGGRPDALRAREKSPRWTGSWPKGPRFWIGKMESYLERRPCTGRPRAASSGRTPLGPRLSRGHRGPDRQLGQAAGTGSQPAARNWRPPSTCPFRVRGRAVAVVHGGSCRKT